MTLPLFCGKPRPDTIATLYGMIVAQARLPGFYRDYGVSDTVNGRFDMIVLHVALLLRRLKDETAEMQALGQGVFDLFCRDMDDNLREMGIGDLAIPKEMRRIGDAFYGRARAYEAALATGAEQPLVDAMERNIFGQIAGQIAGLASARPAGARWLAAYMREAAGQLAARDGAALARGELSFPDPAGFAVPATIS